MQLITEDRFTVLLRGRSLRSIIRDDWKIEVHYFEDGDSPTKKELINSVYYFEEPETGELGMWIPELHMWSVPENQEFPEAEPVIQSSDWCLERISEKRNPAYLINQYRKDGQFTHPYLPISEGEWRITNRRTGEVFEFSAITKSSWYEDGERVNLCYPKKAEDVIHIRELTKFENLLCQIIYLLNGNTTSTKKKDQSGDTES